MINAVIGITLFILIILSVNFKWADKGLDAYFDKWIPVEEKLWSGVLILIAILLAAGIIWQTFLA